MKKYHLSVALLLLCFLIASCTADDIISTEHTEAPAAIKEELAEAETLIEDRINDILPEGIKYVSLLTNNDDTYSVTISLIEPISVDTLGDDAVLILDIVHDVVDGINYPLKEAQIFLSKDDDMVFNITTNDFVVARLLDARPGRTALVDTKISSMAQGIEYALDKPFIETVWATKEYIDQFGISTGEKYISSGSLTGQFSNTATKNSTLKATIMVDEDSISIMLYEYGNQQVTNASSRNSTDYSITIRDETDSRSNFSGEMLPGGNRIHISAASRNRMITLLSGDSDLNIYIVNNDRTTTTYLFDVTPSNFADLYRDIG